MYTAEGPTATGQYPLTCISSLTLRGGLCCIKKRYYGNLLVSQNSISSQNQRLPSLSVRAAFGWDMGFFKPQDSGQNPRVQACFASKHSGLVPGCEIPSWAAVYMGNLDLCVSVILSNAPGSGWDPPSIGDRQTLPSAVEFLAASFQVKGKKSETSSAKVNSCEGNEMEPRGRQ